MQSSKNDELSARDVSTKEMLEQNNEFKHAIQHNTNTNVSDSIALNGRPVVVGLRRQPTVYPHGLGISVQTIRVDGSDNYKSYSNYSNASTLRSENCQDQHSMCAAQTSEQNCHRKYKISMVGNPESLAELQVRRYKYPLTGNYYLDPQDQITKVPLVFKYYEYAKRYCRWKYVRWPIIFLASVLLFFGLITYCIWLHDVSIARQRYLEQRRFQFGLNEKSSEDASTGLDTVRVLVMTTTTTSTERSHPMQESTLLRAIGTVTGSGTRTRHRPKEQKLTTNDYLGSKGTVEWEKNKVNQYKKTTLPPEGITVDDYSTDEKKDDLERIRFTSGHQNNFGVPIEEDERILRLINKLNLNEPLQTSLTSHTKVSPTIPPVQQLSPTTAMEKDSRPSFVSQDNGCYSTAIPMCQGVLEYDLTYNSSVQISQYEENSFQSLVNSNCSARALEFICALIEPECRPSHIGILPPCRRICKAILEACSVEISNSDVLSNIFDCNLYPDSSDPHKCEDPTRRSDSCYDNEFECYDRTCIPHQWQCDNIKDCEAGEDEDECLQCDHQNEFRCRSNDKCVLESVRCDSTYDCFDGSDEDDCEEYGSGDESAAAFDEAAVNSFPRVFSYASYLSPNQSNEDGLFSYITAANDDESGTKFEIHGLANRTSGVSKEDVTNSMPGSEGPIGFVNFRDSKEIMMTSDSENKFKFSAARGNRNSSRYSIPSTLRLTTTKTTTSRTTKKTLATTTFEPATTHKPIGAKNATVCASHQLRCISGKCITVDQLCDKKIDCPDGADELMCVYKQVRSTTKRSPSGSFGKGDVPVTTASPDTTRSDRRTIRTSTVKRRLKV